MTQGEIIDSARSMARVLSDKKCEEITLLDISAVSTIADCFIIATASSPQLARAVTDGIAALASQRPLSTFTRPVISDGAQWTLMDYGSIVVHLFTAEGRAFYELDKVWFEAKKLTF